MFDDPELGAQSANARWLFVGLLTQADRRGRLEDDPPRLKTRLCAYDETARVPDLLAELERGGFIRRYVAKNGLAAIQIVQFEKHQRPHPNEPESVIPADRREKKRGLVKCPTGKERILDSGSLDSGSLEAGSLENSSEALTRSEPAFLEFPVVGTGGAAWTLSEAQAVEWESLFPGLDVRTECRKALAWAHANPTRRKTPRGMPAFLTRWLSKATDRSSGHRSATGASMAGTSAARQQRQAAFAEAAARIRGDS